jgi:hypothetical protein
MIWAVTTHFNPFSDSRRLDAYKVFRAHLQFPLLTVELACADDAFELASTDADQLLQVRGDCMWQKERLINLAAMVLPPACDALLVIDADVLLPKDVSWRVALDEALARFNVLQPYGRVNYLDQAGEVEAVRISRAAMGGYGDNGLHFPPGPNSGLLWAVRRDFVRRFGFYENCLVGGGDTALAGAAFGCPEVAARMHLMNPQQAAAYEAWSRPVVDHIGGRVGVVGGTVKHIWHGAERDYLDRHAILAPWLDPRVDIAYNSDGALVWNSDKPALHAAVRQYFRQRTG